VFTPATRNDKEQIESAIMNVERRFSGKVERIRYSIGEDWASDPAIFFRILLKDEAIPRSASRELRTRAVSEISNFIIESLKSEIQADDFQPYFSVRTVSEQRELLDPKWD
jgi:hypothetical protein